MIPRDLFNSPALSRRRAPRLRDLLHAPGRLSSQIP